MQGREAQRVCLNRRLIVLSVRTLLLLLLMMMTVTTAIIITEQKYA
jgi:hypothetical protein